MKTIKKFTLIELLVVLGIIAILLSLLLPSLRNARREAYKAVCTSNLKQQGTAMLAITVNGSPHYGQGALPNYGGYLPNSDHPLLPDNGDFRWQGLIMNYMTDSNKYGKPNENLDAEELDLFKCPDTINNSVRYGINYTGAGGFHIKEHHGPSSSVNLNEIDSPSQRIHVLDAEIFVVRKNSLSYPHSSRHSNNRTNSLFVDLHVNTLSEAELRQESSDSHEWGWVE